MKSRYLALSFARRRSRDRAGIVGPKGALEASGKLCPCRHSEALLEDKAGICGYRHSSHFSEGVYRLDQ